MLTDAVILDLVLGWERPGRPSPRDFIGVLYELEVAYAEALWESTPPGERRLTPDRSDDAGEWRHWLTRGGRWPIVPPPMPDIKPDRRLQIPAFEMHSPWHLIGEIPPAAWAAGSAFVTVTVTKRLQIVAGFVRALEELSGARGRIRNEELEQQLREAVLRGDIAEAEARRFRLEDELEEVRPRRQLPFVVLEGEILPAANTRS
jgi:hypothetical protein